jgi:hypothetical protein
MVGSLWIAAAAAPLAATPLAPLYPLLVAVCLDQSLSGSKELCWGTPQEPLIPLPDPTRPIERAIDSALQGTGRTEAESKPISALATFLITLGASWWLFKKLGGTNETGKSAPRASEPVAAEGEAPGVRPAEAGPPPEAGPVEEPPVSAPKKIEFIEFPADPNQFTKQLGVQPSKVSLTKDRTTRMVWEPNPNTRIRYESHPEGLEPGDPEFNPRHHGEHYHVETKPDGLSWNQAEKQSKIIKSKPDGYTPGSGTGFLPGEPLPGQ